MTGYALSEQEAEGGYPNGLARWSPYGKLPAGARYCRARSLSICLPKVFSLLMRGECSPVQAVPWTHSFQIRGISCCALGRRFTDRGLGRV